MVEIFNLKCTISLGCFENFEAAKGTLTALAQTKKLGKKPAVIFCSYKMNEPQQEYFAEYFGDEWHVSQHSTSQILPKIEEESHKKAFGKANRYYHFSS